jgi:hypothetical protein
MEDDRRSENPHRESPVLEYAALSGTWRQTGLVTVTTFANAWEANLALHKLNAEGIPATLADQEVIAASGGAYAGAVGGIKLQVPAGEVERARAALPQPGARTIVKCPRCGSKATHMVPQAPFVRMLVLLLLGMPSVLFGRRWRCEACGNQWRRSIYEESDDDEEEHGDRHKSNDEQENEEDEEAEDSIPRQPPVS